jgi:hypothetical protein
MPTASQRKRDLASLVLTQVMVNADGTFVYTGFKPAFVLVDKKINASDWYMFDNKRNSFNQVQ